VSGAARITALSAIEQAQIARNPGFENVRNSISPTHDYYDQAVAWGNQWLRARGF
jgi:hypothetical protein